MRLRGIEFGRVWGASGVQGFFGEGYWYHPLLKPFGLSFNGMTFVAKTTTLNYNPGNMNLGDDLTPTDLFPNCIYVNPWRGVALNAIGLSGPGARNLFERGLWQEKTEPFFLSFMSTGQTSEVRLRQLQEFIRLLEYYLPDFHSPIGFQINYSCPNVGLHVEALLSEVFSGLEAARTLDIPLVPKFNLLLPIEAARNISAHPACDAICISNTIPYGQLPDRINWKKMFGNASPLERYNGGGLSGKPLLPLLLEWLRRARVAGITKPINAGGGILSKRSAARVFQSGADSIFLGSIAFLRPWRVRGIIRRFN